MHEKLRARAENRDTEELVKDTELQTPAMEETVSVCTDGLGVTDAANSEASYADALPRAAAMWARSSIPWRAERRRERWLRRGGQRMKC